MLLLSQYSCVANKRLNDMVNQDIMQQRLEVLIRASAVAKINQLAELRQHLKRLTERPTHRNLVTSQEVPLKVQLEALVKVAHISK
jgi:hypothetical protein